MAKEDHALVKIGDMTIPLIGVPIDAGLEECDLCHDLFRLWDIVYNGTQFLCFKCGPQFCPFCDSDDTYNTGEFTQGAVHYVNFVCNKCKQRSQERYQLDI